MYERLQLEELAWTMLSVLTLTYSEVHKKGEATDETDSRIAELIAAMSCLASPSKSKICARCESNKPTQAPCPVTLALPDAGQVICEIRGTNLPGTSGGNGPPQVLKPLMAVPVDFVSILRDLLNPPVEAKDSLSTPTVVGGLPSGLREDGTIESLSTPAVAGGRPAVPTCEEEEDEVAPG